MSEQTKKKEVERLWYVFFSKENHESLPFETEEAALAAGKERPEVVSILRSKDSYCIWVKAAALILALLILCGGNAKAQILIGGGTNLQGSATAIIATNNYNVVIPALTITLGNAINPATLFTGNELFAIGPTNANPVFVTNNGYVYVAIASTNYQYSANAGTNGVTLVMPAIQGAGQQMVTGLQVNTGTNTVNVLAHF